MSRILLSTSSYKGNLRFPLNPSSFFVLWGLVYLFFYSSRRTTYLALKPLIFFVSVGGGGLVYFTHNLRMRKCVYCTLR